jgi:transposase
MSTVTVLRGPERRRRWTSAEKQRIVEESLSPGTTVVDVARRHDIHPNLLHVWRRQARTGTGTSMRQRSAAPANEVQFAPVSISRDEQVLAAPGMIEIEFASGTRLRISPVDAATVSAVIAAVARDERGR